MKEEEEDSQEFNQSPANPPIPENTQPERKIQIQFSIVDKWKEIMKAIKEKTGIDGIYVVLFLLVCVILVYLGIFGTLITNMVGTLYPGFSTIKTMETNPAKKKEWLTYWVVFGFFIIVDMFSGIIMKIIPFYFVLKILFLIWMFLPGSSGCYLVYTYVILKLFKSIEDKVDFLFSESKKITSQVNKDLKKVGAEKMKNVTKKLKNINLLKNRGGGFSMEEAVNIGKEIDKEENESNNSNVLRSKTQNDDYSEALKSNIVSFPNKMQNKYFKDQLNDIVKEKEKNEIKEVKEENQSEFMSNIVLDNKSSEAKKEEKKEEEKKEEEKKEEVKKEEEKKEPEKPKEKEEGEKPQEKNFTEQIDDLEQLLTGNVFSEENKEDDGEKKTEIPEDNNNNENKMENKDNNQ